MHDTVDPSTAYAPGIRIALAAAREARGVVVGLDAFIDIGVRTRPEQPEAPVDDGDVSGQVAGATSA